MILKETSSGKTYCFTVGNRRKIHLFVIVFAVGVRREIRVVGVVVVVVVLILLRKNSRFLLGGWVCVCVCVFVVYIFTSE